MRLSADSKVLLEGTNQDIDASGAFSVPNSVTSIGDKAFNSCTGLVHIIIEGDDDAIKKLLPDELHKLIVPQVSQ